MISSNNAVINAIGSDFSKISDDKIEVIEKEITKLNLVNTLELNYLNSHKINDPIEELNKDFKMKTIKLHNIYILKLGKDKNLLENILFNVHNADVEGAANLDGLSSALIKIDKIFIENF